MRQLSELTTMRVGGPVRQLLEPADADQLVEATRDAWNSNEPWLILGGGSNLVVTDDGFDGTVIRVVTQGVERVAGDEGTVTLRVQAGESWDGLVAGAIEQGLVGLEALSGIPGRVGAAPIQNIGAYGQELSDSLVAIDFLDVLTGEVTRVPAQELKLGYRTSAIKQGRHGLVVAVELRLSQGELSEPIAYSQLASALGVQLGDRVPTAEVRSAVLRLRSSKGMVLSPEDPDSVSSGSFFTNPIVGARFASELPADAPRWPLGLEQADAVLPLETFDADAVPRRAVSEGQVKLSAAWLIEQAGISRGFSLPGSHAAISSKHTLALVNTGGATAEQVAELARYVQNRVFNQFGVLLQPEPVLVGVQL
ncbi:MAG: UDP-N-acetylmuramate dehydrogenase [Homoserinimonas sp.]